MPFDKLQAKREQIAFWLTVPLLFTIGFSALSAASSPRPELVGESKQIGKGGQWKGLPDLQNSVFIVESITNAGNAPSIAHNFTLTVTLHGKKYEGESTAFGDGIITLAPKNTDSEVQYNSNDMLYNKALISIQPGGQVTGILLFIFPNLSNGTLEAQADVEFTLGFQDARGRFYVQPLDTSSEKYQSQVVPGIYQSIRKLKQEPTQIPHQ